MSARFALLLLIVTLAVGAGCDSDPDTPLGTSFFDDGLIDSDPGVTYQDTLFIASGDVSFVVNSSITKAPTMDIGRKNNFESSMMLRFNFSNPGNDTLRTVDRAWIRLRRTDTQTDSLQARFFEFLTPFSENDTLSSLDLAATPIPDSSGVVVDRIMSVSELTYTLPAALVQDWIRGVQDHFGIAITLNDTTTTKDLEYGTRTNGDTTVRPSLQVLFTDQVQSAYSVSDDGTFLVDLAPPTSDLQLADGVTRRVFVPVDLSAFSDSLLLHDARLIFRVVADTWTGGDNSVELYASEADSVSDPGILDGDFVVGALLAPERGVLELPVRSRIQQYLGDPTINHGLVLRFSLEGSEIRSILFYGSANPDSLKPFFSVTYSEPPVFPESP